MPLCRSIQLTVLCDLLHVGEPCEWHWAQRVQERGTEGQRGPGHTLSPWSPSCPRSRAPKQPRTFHPCSLAKTRASMSSFCVSIQLLNKTWKEMWATQED